MKISEHFDIRELVDKATYTRNFGQSIKLIDPRIPVLLEKIRELCGNRPMTVNNWHIGGQFQYRGYRPPDCQIGALKSMHKQGKAVDFDVKGMTADQVRGVIRLNQVELMKLGLTRMETGVSWVHIDLKETGLQTIKEFRP
ncbi:MAG TPA: D-Ala-D-Ala carboxypeptidase family metallohydrolase [Lentimicrobium sp.]|nr:D-Ala-D-Ala carboxypeptidase family metallohydrolase [Lentimicrobium sp.]